jgi:poly(beta-D-mannuronate) lyase
MRRGILVGVLAGFVSLPAAGDTIFDPRPISGVAVRNVGTVLIDVAARRRELANMPPITVSRLCSTETFARLPPEDARQPVVSLAGRATYGNSLDRSAEPFAVYLMRTSGLALAAPSRGVQQARADLMLAWARADALTRYLGDDFNAMNNSLYSGNRAALPAIAAAALLDDAIASGRDDRAEIEAWLGRVVFHLWVDPGTLSSQNNHRVLRDSVHMAYGALVGNPVEFAMGVQGFAREIRTARTDGALPFEIIRGARALFYQNFAIASLVTMAEIGAGQGYDLYTFRSETNVDVHQVIAFLLRGLDDPSIVLPEARENAFAPAGSDPSHQDFIFLRPTGGTRHYMAWVEPYVRRFPGHPNAVTLKRHFDTGEFQRPMIDELSGGNTSCMFAPP